ncbi:hypothetical protein ACFVZM_13535 [Streptomyces sioyaensis]
MAVRRPNRESGQAKEMRYEVMTVPVAVLRSGNIVTDLMFKVLRQFDA